MPGELDPKWVEVAPNSPAIARHLREASGSTAQPHLYLKDIRATAIPIPPPDELNEILRRVDDASTYAEDTENMLERGTANVTRLRQSILKRAFSGRLVPQDPSDEPAVALLARLRAAEHPTPARRNTRPKVPA